MRSWSTCLAQRPTIPVWQLRLIWCILTWFLCLYVCYQTPLHSFHTLGHASTHLRSETTWWYEPLLHEKQAWGTMKTKMPLCTFITGFDTSNLALHTCFLQVTKHEGTECGQPPTALSCLLHGVSVPMGGIHCPVLPPPRGLCTHGQHPLEISPARTGFKIILNGLLPCIYNIKTITVTHKLTMGKLRILSVSIW